MRSVAFGTLGFRFGHYLIVVDVCTIITLSHRRDIILDSQITSRSLLGEQATTTSNLCYNTKGKLETEKQPST